mmetsp:Transcript_7112/g.22768  ORF Transcript_7112/g.22768 Transcript_7112/m.22768 type:complete len:225 (-) Transcript_7112:744-1418(-)
MRRRASSMASDERSGSSARSSRSDCDEAVRTGDGSGLTGPVGALPAVRLASRPALATDEEGGGDPAVVREGPPAAPGEEALLRRRRRVLRLPASRLLSEAPAPGVATGGVAVARFRMASATLAVSPSAFPPEMRTYTASPSAMPRARKLSLSGTGGDAMSRNRCHCFSAASRLACALATVARTWFTKAPAAWSTGTASGLRMFNEGTDTMIDRSSWRNRQGQSA